MTRFAAFRVIGLGAAIRGRDESSGSLFSDVDLEERVPRGNPLRAIRDLTNAVLAEMLGEFEAL